MKKRTTIIIALFSCLLWGLVFPILKLLYLEINVIDDFAKLTLAGMRFFAAGILVLIYYTISNKQFPKISSISDFSKLSILGVFQTTLVYALFFVGTSNTSGIKSAVLSQSSIFFVVILAHFLLKDEKINSKKNIALILGIIGMSVININNLGSKEGFFDFKLIGEGYLIISGLFGAIGTIQAKKFGKDFNAVLMNGWQLTIGGALLLIIGILTYGKLISFPNTYSFILFLLLVLISAIAFTLWYIILKYVKASEITIYKFTIPIIGAISSAILLPSEKFSFYSLTGLMLVSIGIYYSNKSNIKIKETNL